MKKYIVWGALGFLKGKEQIEAVTGQGTFAFFVDFNYKSLKDVHPIEDILKYPEYTVIVNHSHTKNVKDFISYYNPKNEFLAPLVPYHPYSKFDHEEQSSFYAKVKNELENIFLHDELSMSLLDNFLYVLSLDKPILLPYDNERIQRFYSIDTKYFPEDVYLPSKDLTLIDCGAWKGDSAIEFINRFKARAKKISLIEPAKESLIEAKKLLQNINNVQIEFLPFGVSDSDINGNFVYSSNYSMGSYFIENESANSECDNTVKLCTIDSLDIKPIGLPIIKMDIEGFELNALKGAKEYCKKYRPVLAFCLYHKSHDLYDLPKFISSLDLGYKCYLRSPLHPVCYAICE